MNKLCFLFHFNEVCRCMWQVNIERVWRKELQPRRCAERRRLQPNEEWTLIIRRIRLPRETSTLARTQSHAHTHTHTRLVIYIHLRGQPQTSRGFHFRLVLCRWHTLSSCRHFWVFSALQSDVVDAPVAVVPMETDLLEEHIHFWDQGIRNEIGKNKRTPDRDESLVLAYVFEGSIIDSHFLEQLGPCPDCSHTIPLYDREYWLRAADNRKNSFIGRDDGSLLAVAFISLKKGNHLCL